MNKHNMILLKIINIKHGPTRSAGNATGLAKPMVIKFLKNGMEDLRKTTSK
jgi:hypothetical protein